jgi:hypothetical protein
LYDLIRDLVVDRVGFHQYFSVLYYRPKLLTYTMKPVYQRSPWIFRSLTLIILLLTCFVSVFAQDAPKDVRIFDGKTLTGWKVTNPADKSLWKVVDGVLTGGDGVQKIKTNTYIQTEKEYGDFEFRCLFRLSGDPSTGMINSGIQYRSKVVDGNMVGYQADIGNGFWGDIYDEHRRGKLVGGDLSVLKHLLKEDGWNSYIIRVKGNLHTLYINGVKTCDYVEKDPSVPSRGIIAIQLHSGGAAVIQFKDIFITEL